MIGKVVQFTNGVLIKRQNHFWCQLFIKTALRYAHCDKVAIAEMTPEDSLKQGVAIWLMIFIGKRRLLS